MEVWRTVMEVWSYVEVDVKEWGGGVEVDVNSDV